MKLLNYHSFRAAESIRAEWDQLVRDTGSAIYQTFDWCRIWWRHYGQGRSLHLLACRCDSTLSGVLPLFGETLRCGPLRLRVLKPLGADHSLQHCDAPVLPHALSPILNHLREHFLANHEFDIIRFGPLGANSPSPADWQDALSSAALHYSSHPSSPLTLFHLPDSTETFWKSLPAKLRRECESNWRKLTSRHSCSEHTTTSPDALQQAFAEFHDLHQSQWSASGKSSHFGDWPRSLAFNHDLTRTYGKLGQVAFFRILTPSAPVASQFTFLHQNTCHWRLPARNPSSPWMSLSLGKVALARMIHHAIELGAHSIEAGTGHYPYKTRFGATEIPLCRISCCLPTRTSMLRLQAANLASAAIHRAYYKLWFLKLRPHFPSLQLPLHPTWIRWS